MFFCSAGLSALCYYAVTLYMICPYLLQYKSMVILPWPALPQVSVHYIWIMVSIFISLVPSASTNPRIHCSMESLKACIIKLWSAHVFCLKAFTPPDTTLIIILHQCFSPQSNQTRSLLSIDLSPVHWDEVDYTIPNKVPWQLNSLYTNDLHKTNLKINKTHPTVNLVVVMTELDRVYKGVVTLVVTCFIEDGLIHSALTPSRLVNINVSALRIRLFPPSRTSAGKSH